MNILELIKMIENKGGKLKLSDLKDFYLPIDLADKLKVMVDEGIIKINWKNDLILLEQTRIQSIHSSKVALTKKIVTTPNYMKTEKIEKNKPFIP